MKKVIKDGWHKLAGYEVYVEDGYVIRGVVSEFHGLSQHSVYPYERCIYGGWSKCTPLAITFTSRIRRGTLIMR